MKHRYIKNAVTLSLIADKCIGCGMCAQVCPHGVFAVNDRNARIVDKDLCMECGACVKNCPVNAIEVNAGVGCASAIIKSWFTGREPVCGCDNSGDCC